MDASLYVRLVPLRFVKLCVKFPHGSVGSHNISTMLVAVPIGMFQLKAFGPSIHPDASGVLVTPGVGEPSIQTVPVEIVAELVRAGPGRADGSKVGNLRRDAGLAINTASG